MKILFINPVLRTAETNTIPTAESIKDSLGFTFCKAFLDLGHDITLFAAHEYRPSRDEHYPFRVVFAKSRLKWIFTPRVIPFLPGLAWHLLRQGGEYDLIVTSELHTLHSLMAALIRPGRTVVWHELSHHFRLLRQIPSRLWFALSRPVYSRVRSICPRSPRARDFLLQYYRNVAADPIGHGVDLDKFEVSEIPADEFIVCSQLIERKRVDDTIAKFAKYLAKYPDARENLLILGDGDRRASLEAQAGELKIADRVRFLGKRSHSEMVPLLSRAKAMLISSRRDLTLLSISESIACGTPVVVHDNVDSSDAIREHGLGVASSDWTEDDLRAVSKGSEGFRAACRANRHRFSNLELARRMAEFAVVRAPATTQRRLN